VYALIDKGKPATVESAKAKERYLNLSIARRSINTVSIAPSVLLSIGNRGV
jgi:hypothetical protein